MFQMNDREKEKFDQLMSSFRQANSIDETRYYFDLIQEFLNTLQVEKGMLSSKMSAEELKKFESLKQQMLNAHDTKEVTHFEKQMHELIDRANMSKT
ncbi:hypothetical protein [Halobacillus sp. BBL2006]|uniref:hypothetical protein n=1 Tax=Halobacillus sp. BBL2006 TaxID=1543706 RepID=UPI000541D02E|nr:hypothetical protein [Halobacillus sp. BBL2006]KHE72997.1 hypothetical protein LD39_01605 [Halobacillus sp. BBL2006]